jgi:phosphohistidine phosphatase
MVILVHHADAVDPAIEPQRPLSATGREQAAFVANALAAHAVKPACVWHSGKLRARQTAEAIRKACNPLAELAAIRGILPDDPPDWIKDRLTAEARTVVVVGHMPHLPRVVQALVRNLDEGKIDFPAHGAIALEEVDERWVERWRIELTT